MVLDEGHITNVAVLPDFRRKGIAVSLITSIFELSRAEGVTKYTLEVRASNETAISLYKRMNFEECGVRKKYYENNSEDAVIMWKT
jgi:ribosomal-protein-alanine N-acetyltransferase